MAITTVGDIILSVRAQIPDRAPGDDPRQDGNAFGVATLLRWINDAGRLICLSAPVIQDWSGFPSMQGQDVYVLPNYVTSVEQAWYNLLPMTRSPEADALFTSKIQGRAWWFGPHSLHAIPRLHVWPAPDENGNSTTLSAQANVGDTTLSLTSVTGFEEYGFAELKDATNTEVVRYATVDSASNQLKNVLRGQGGTLERQWVNGSTINEGNIFYKCFRLPRPLTDVTEPVEIPQALWPLVELYVIAKVREAEQDHQTAAGMRQEFNQTVELLASKHQLKGLRQGLQVQLAPVGISLWRSRVFIP